MYVYIYKLNTKHVELYFLPIFNSKKSCDVKKKNIFQNSKILRLCEN